MHLLVTRPRDDAGPLAAELQRRGHRVSLEPLLKIVATAAPGPAHARYQAVLVTSANGVRGLVTAGLKERLRDTRVLAVGAASAVAAHEAGFSDVTSADGDLETLAGLVGAACVPGDGVLLYACGSTVSGDLKGMLEAPGYSVERLSLYEARPAKALSRNIGDELKAGTIDGVLLFSPRTAGIWSTLIRAEGLMDTMGALRFYCLSRAVAAKVSLDQGISHASLRVAESPDIEALLDVIEADSKTAAI